ncbi:MAG: response regulator transcription factor [Ferrimicrobium sp.]|uniref:Response regulator transcription factor n=1 Tax=Ferrimicrobium acidiphilum TaxID=121039 RepID=A0ABV3Y5R7_9ACTN|nr:MULTISPECIES: response regulator transcription factor [Ferrimicrobium]MCL5053132.1 response regulator transcription factor [Gammaproteobacteria bacterium]
MRVLIVEDHPEMGSWIRKELLQLQWECDIAETLSAARRFIRQAAYDVLLLDIMLPDGSGIELCQELRMSVNAAIIMVTARDDVSDRIEALDKGADDYVIKPFAIEELVARIRAVSRRITGDRGPVLEFCDLRLWTEERSVEQHGQPLELSRREFDLLEAFMRNSKKVLTRDQLLEIAWGYVFFAESNVVDVTVKRLRERLDPEGQVAIDTVRGVGYVLRSSRE